ncbi:3'(2'),5'-bisphosphate nucleotidase CysQ, partial [Candidatus Woesearchaeota archaeon]|nr:3'(2'),5'-bisphosphate nucleotidase CysQ [Candidatus Woesearchaeota archaeon]
LDGTKDFIMGGDGFSVMIGLLVDKRPVLGVVYAPLQETFFFAESGAGAFMERKGLVTPLRVSESDNLSTFRLIVSKHHFEKIDAAFAEFLACKDFVQRGSIGVKFAEIAHDGADLYFNFDGLNIWDVCAPQAILEAAGGQVFDISGEKLVYGPQRFTKGIIALNASNKEPVLEKIRSFQKSFKNES